MNLINSLELKLDSKDTPEYKKNQLKSKIYKLKKKYQPNVFWDSSIKGTYKKPIEVNK